MEIALRDGEITKVVTNNYEKFILNDHEILNVAADCFGYRGECLYETKRSKEARDSLNFALELEKDREKLQHLHNLKAMTSRSLALAFRKNNSGDFNGNDYKFYFEESKKHYEEAIKLMPEIDDKKTMYIENLAKLFEEFNYLQKAIEQYEIAHQMDEYDREIIIGLIRVSISSGDHERERKYRDKFDNLDKR